jgi:hypothetical protein
MNCSLRSDSRTTREGDSPKGPISPDYYTVDASFVSPQSALSLLYLVIHRQPTTLERVVLSNGFVFTVTKSGQVFVGVQTVAGVPGGAVAYREGYIHSDHGAATNAEIESFVTGESTTLSGGLALFPPDAAVGAGPSAAVSLGNVPTSFGGNEMHKLQQSSNYSDEEGVGLFGGHTAGAGLSYSWSLYKP